MTKMTSPGRISGRSCHHETLAPPRPLRLLTARHPRQRGVPPVGPLDAPVAEVAVAGLAAGAEAGLLVAVLRSRRYVSVFAGIYVKKNSERDNYKSVNIFCSFNTSVAYKSLSTFNTVHRPHRHQGRIISIVR
jgi:hypothetical protein